MALGQSGPPASPKQVAYLQALLEKAGFASFREARHTFGLTQRQAGGKFAKQEASDLIDRLVNGESPEAEAPSFGGKADDRAEAKASVAQATLLRGIPAQLLADELLSRGWSVHEPR
jgi:hypothetical protein